MNNRKNHPLITVDGRTLMDRPLEPPNFVVDTLLAQGLHILAGSPKVGKSWLALWLAVTVAKGEPVWNLTTKQGTIGTPTELSERIDPDRTEGVTPKKISRMILQSAEALRKVGIAAVVRRSNGKRVIELHRADSVDLEGAGEIVPIDPAVIDQPSGEGAAGAGATNSSHLGGQAEPSSDFVGLGAAGNRRIPGRSPDPL